MCVKDNGFKKLLSFSVAYVIIYNSFIKLLSIECC